MTSFTNESHDNYQLRTEFRQLKYDFDEKLREFNEYNEKARATIEVSKKMISPDVVFLILKQQ
ncbi:MAG TPA: hypothetical protein VM101_11280 [Flavitalea sp.]|nr:hypothetical protein [Flavitalea sp.]